MKEKLGAFIDQNNFLAIGEHNPKVKQIRAIISNSKPNPHRFFIAEGIFLIKQILKADSPINSLILCPELIKTEEAFTAAMQAASKCSEHYVLSLKVYSKLCEREKPDGLMAIAQLKQNDIKTLKCNDKSIILVLDGVEIPGNVGTIIRMADGAGLDAVFICNRRTRLTHPKSIRGSQGAVLTVPVFEFEVLDDCRNWLYDNGFKIYLADTRAEHSYFEEPFGKKTAIIMGSERYGITRDWYSGENTMISIPMLGTVDSLNVGVAATVLCYEASIKNKLSKKRNR